MGNLCLVSRLVRLDTVSRMDPVSGEIGEQMVMKPFGPLNLARGSDLQVGD